MSQAEYEYHRHPNLDGMAEKLLWKIDRMHVVV